ncbi:hypothetical protein [Rhodococcus sp. B10]|uniref:hypothetical protein n=1 Tax=Rhodococcus sp. B10 TaxID=2695876 RepID=UPI0014300715|nr:hypothetical protein [Rhodococcus sp. B10]
MDYDYLALDCTDALGVLFVPLLDFADAIFRLSEVAFSLGDSLLVVVDLGSERRLFCASGHEAVEGEHG